MENPEIRVIIPPHIVTTRLMVPGRLFIINGEQRSLVSIMDLQMQKEGRDVFLTAAQYEDYKKGIYKIPIVHDDTYATIFMNDTAKHETFLVKGCTVYF